MTKLVPARNVGSSVISASYAACASAVWLEFSPPPVRNGSPKCRASCPVHSSPIPDSGVPKDGDPDCMSMVERNEPKITGQHGLIILDSEMQDRAPETY